MRWYKKAQTPQIDRKRWHAARKLANDFLHGLARQYHQTLPVREMDEKLASLGIEMEKDFILTGYEGKATFDLRMDGQPAPGMLVFTWYRMESGRFEINAYVS